MAQLYLLNYIFNTQLKSGLDSCHARRNWAGHTINMVLEPTINKPILPPQKHTLRFTSETQMKLSAREVLSYKIVPHGYVRACKGFIMVLSHSTHYLKVLGCLLKSFTNTLLEQAKVVGLSLTITLHQEKISVCLAKSHPHISRDVKV